MIKILVAALVAFVMLWLDVPALLGWMEVPVWVAMFAVMTLVAWSVVLVPMAWLAKKGLEYMNHASNVDHIREEKTEDTLRR